eukprot:2295494-Rhodomonas_salina.1
MIWKYSGIDLGILHARALSPSSSSASCAARSASSAERFRVAKGDVGALSARIRAFVWHCGGCRGVDAQRGVR